MPCTCQWLYPFFRGHELICQVSEPRGSGMPTMISIIIMWIALRCKRGAMLSTPQCRHFNTKWQRLHAHHDHLVIISSSTKCQIKYKVTICKYDYWLVSSKDKKKTPQSLFVKTNQTLVIINVTVTFKWMTGY